MGLKKWMSAVKSGQDGSKMMSRKQNRKQAKRLRKLQSVACARHQPIEKIMEEAFRSKIESKSKTKKRKRKIKQMEAELKANEEGHDEEESKPKRRRKQRGGDSSSESDSDADLTYDQYMKEVQDKKRKIALDDDAAKQDNIDIHKYSKLLGIKELKNGKKPKSFVYDGLDDLLEFCDTDDRRKLLATSTDQEIVLKGDDLDEGEEEDEVEEDIDEAEDLDDEDIDELAVDDEEGDEDNADGDSQAGVSEDDDANEDNKSENGEEEEYKEDIYGRKVSKKTGKVVTFDIRGAHKKLEDLDAKGGDNESRVQIERVLMGTLNRLSEGTLVRSHQVVSETWQKNSKNDVKASLTRILCRLIGAPYRMQDHLLSLYAMFMAHIHTFTSEEISAYFVEVFLRDFVEEISKPLTQDDKKLENSVVFIAHMLNFHMIKATVVLEVFEKLREKLNVDNLQLIVTLATFSSWTKYLEEESFSLSFSTLVAVLDMRYGVDSYKVFRKLHWIPFSEELAKISTDLETAVFAALPRAKFLGETLSSLQKSPPTNVDMSVIEHHLKVFQGLRKKNKASSDKELGMSLDDLLHADERGRW
ncbi:unnamed protein product [Heligmosomoides polygyrus]|uniref:MIF4G domain-containing protein n=1 Tax=Heligmosomoides polygyrus TaxID=6339 RepID=A0A183F2W2_HELPZ|nr:unnamed protein product [Heligmosomoides polygyrus]